MCRRRGRAGLARCLAHDRRRALNLSHAPRRLIETVKEKYYDVPDAQFSRVERTVEMWPDFASILVNQELNDLAAKRGARGVATENTLNHSIAMHVEYHGYIWKR